MVHEKSIFLGNFIRVLAVLENLNSDDSAVLRGPFESVQKLSQEIGFLPDISIRTKNNVLSNQLVEKTGRRYNPIAANIHWIEHIIGTFY